MVPHKGSMVKMPYLDPSFFVSAEGKTPAYRVFISMKTNITIEQHV